MKETINRLQAAQAFMNRHGVLQCWEVNGRFYKRLENAMAAGSKPSEHRLSAGIRKKDNPKICQ